MPVLMVSGLEHHLVDPKVDPTACSYWSSRCRLVVRRRLCLRSLVFLMVGRRHRYLVVGRPCLMVDRKVDHRHLHLVVCRVVVRLRLEVLPCPVVHRRVVPPYLEARRPEESAGRTYPLI